MNRTSYWPDFLIAGAARSGTTYLSELLDAHSAITVARPLIPEPKVFMEMAERETDYYHARYLELFKNAPEGDLWCEKTSYYFTSPYTMERILKHIGGKIKMIFILRNPVDRAYSNYLWTRKNGLDTEPFDAVWQLSSDDRPNPLPDDRKYVRPYDYFERSLYGKYAELHMRNFPPENLHFLLYEHLLADPEKALSGICDFLAIPASFGRLSHEYTENTTINERVPLSPELRREISSAFEVDIEKLAFLTNLDLSLWNPS